MSNEIDDNQLPEQMTMDAIIADLDADGDSADLCERCRSHTITDHDSGLCSSCTAHNDDRVII